MNRFLPRIPFPKEPFLPGCGQVRPSIKTSELTGLNQYLLGVDLFNSEYYWEAHEVWETVWRRAKDPWESAFLKSLIQFSAAMVHLRLGKPATARRLAYRALGYLGRASEQMAWPLGLNAGFLITKWWKLTEDGHFLPQDRAPILWVDGSRIEGWAEGLAPKP